MGYEYNSGLDTCPHCSKFDTADELTVEEMGQRWHPKCWERFAAEYEQILDGWATLAKLAAEKCVRESTMKFAYCDLCERITMQRCEGPVLIWSDWECTNCDRVIRG